MKANELMIGDWVIIKGHPCKVSYLAPFDIGDIRLSVISNGYDGNPYLDEIGPIPLTAEILEKNGFDEAYSSDIHKCYFRQKDNEDGMELYDIEVNIYSGNQNACHLEVKHFGMGTVKIKFYHVHELQHALRLCGLNEIADNFKTK